MKINNLEPKLSLKEKNSDREAGLFPIVGIGASAGGLEAFEQFLENVPRDSGMAYVLVQHLDPTQKGMLPELLQRICKLKVYEVKDRMAVKPNCVYVIPPNTGMSILKGVLHLFEPIEPRGLRLPIDFFLRSLADDQQEFSIGIILSGMGSDGSVGIRAIKEKNGIVMVQDPLSAKYNSMPLNAIDSVQADIVAPANELPAKLIDFLRCIPRVKSNLELEIKDQSALEKIIILLRVHTGNDFSLYKKTTVYRRIERRMGVHKIDKISSYVRFLQENPKELDILFKELLIGVTNFFRDGLAWDRLKETVLPSLLTNPINGKMLRAWVPGCSTGEEAYSLAIVFKEVQEKINPHDFFSLQIFATDLNAEAIDIARRGLFPESIAADVSPDRLNRFFTTTEEGYRINSEIREMIIFAHHNIILHPPFTKLDILSCRNLLIYMDSELQKKLFGLFYYCINPEGFLLLGSAETLGKQSNFFTTIDSKLKIYKRAVVTQPPELNDFPSSFTRITPPHLEKHAPAESASNIQTLASQLFLDYFSPSGVLVNENGDIVYIMGHTGKYLEPAVGKANLNIFAMLRDGLRNEFPIAFRKVIMNKETVVLNNVRVAGNGGYHNLNVNIQWIAKPEPLRGMVMIIFTDLPEINHTKPELKTSKRTLDSLRQTELEKELQHTREEMQSTLEEMLTSQEELKSTNEELQSTNEELQSANEELTTSKEEMQSMNEELQTLNTELQSKIDDFLRVNNDMKNLLNSTDIATLFLDKELNILRFTNQATKIFKLIKSDIGRPFTDQVTDLLYPELAVDAGEVLRTLIFIEKQIPARDGRWFSVRIMPYRTLDDRIDGLVITFIETTNLRKVELKLEESEQMQRLLLNSSPDIIIELSSAWKILEFNPVAEQFFEKSQKDVIGKNFLEVFIPLAEHKRTERMLKRLINKSVNGKFRMQVLTADGKIHDGEWSGNILTGHLKKESKIVIFTKNP
ncbi:MAG: PAS domain-containing protein [Bacteroidales bacterium]|nr:PAS domain-containing protein [Bacteroidales bacterium]